MTHPQVRRARYGSSVVPKEFRQRDEQGWPSVAFLKDMKETEGENRTWPSLRSGIACGARPSTFAEGRWVESTIRAGLDCLRRFMPHP
jgi:hypothetical protein